MAERFHEKLVRLRVTARNSSFMKSVNLIGSSLLFIHDENDIGLHVIDFGKTRKVNQEAGTDDQLSGGYQTSCKGKRPNIVKEALYSNFYFLLNNIF